MIAPLGLAPSIRSFIFIPFGEWRWVIYWVICWEDLFGEEQAKMSKRFYHILKSSRPVLVDFYADWCIPCRLMHPILKEIKCQFKAKVRIIKVNVDHYPDIAMNYQIQNIPAIMLFRYGKVQWSGSGVQQINDISIALKAIL